MLIPINRRMAAATKGRWSAKNRFYLGEKYQVENFGNARLQIGDTCWCHPTEWSDLKEPYQVIITEDENGSILTSYLGVTRMLNDYVFYRLEFIKTN